MTIREAIKNNAKATEEIALYEKENNCLEHDAILHLWEYGHVWFYTIDGIVIRPLVNGTFLIQDERVKTTISINDEVILNGYVVPVYVYVY